jgi:hypothetical protein
MEENRELTQGEKVVGLNFNPSNDETVQELKELFARAFDIVEHSVDVNKLETPDHSVSRSRKMRDCALENIITAQMWAVKVVTLKY